MLAIKITMTMVGLFMFFGGGGLVRNAKEGSNEAAQGAAIAIVGLALFFGAALLGSLGVMPD